MLTGWQKKNTLNSLNTRTMTKTYIGIDVGSHGFISVQQDGHWDFLSIIESDLHTIFLYLSDIKRNHSLLTCVIEDVFAIYGSSAKATFQFGFNKGYLIGLLSACEIPYTLVTPKVWQREMWINADKVYKDGKRIDTKATSINATKRLFPSIDLRRTSSCKNIDDNKFDSMLMCEYGRRKNL
jgi:hypothetical protein